MKNISFFILVILSHYCLGQDVLVSHFPKHLQLYARSDSNTAIVNFNIQLKTTRFDTLKYQLYEDDSLVKSEAFRIVLVSGKAQFNIAEPIKASLTQYRFEVKLHSQLGDTLIAKADSVVCGDVFLINGQSNAAAISFAGSSNAENQSHFIRSFGYRGILNDTAIIRSDTAWNIADGDSWWYSRGGVGQWALRMAKLVVDKYSIPIAIINNAEPGRPISHFMRNDSNPIDITTNYGRLLYRTQKAGLTQGVKAVFYFQGEADSSYANRHEQGLWSLYNNWKTDYSSLSRVYFIQINEGCGAPSLDLRDRQRKTKDVFDDISVMSTTALIGHDGCHYSYLNGYRNLGNNLFNLINFELYNSTDSLDIFPPEPAAIYFSKNDSTELVINFKNVGDSYTFDTNALLDFNLGGDSTLIFRSVDVYKNNAVVALNRKPNKGFNLSYNGHQGSANYWITNKKGVGMFAFFQLPFDNIWPTEFDSLKINSAFNFDSTHSVSWSTGYELNTDNYVLYRIQGNETDSITTVKSVNFSDTITHYLVDSISANIYRKNCYFVELIGRSGTVFYSDTVCIEPLYTPIDTVEQLWVHEIISNSSSCSSFLGLKPNKNQHVNVKLFSAKGNYISDLFSGQMYEYQQLNIPLNLCNLPKSVYFVYIIGENAVFVDKVTN